MLSSTSVSLNALRVFLITAQHMSIKRAAQELSVTPGAVSHQIKSLEHSIGTQLFVRRNNAIELTDVGKQLATDAAPGLRLLSTSLENVIRNTNAIRVRASMSFAVRWLIPKLHQFKSKNPNASVEVETFFDGDRQTTVEADVTIGYYQRDNRPDDAQVLFDDVCRPYLAPVLLSRLSDPGDLTSIPAIQCTKGNWDWTLWMTETGRSDNQLRFAERFDLDDAALRAACAGMGMILSSRFMVEADLEDGRLVPLPGGEDVCVGSYAVHTNGLETGLSKRFVRWLSDVSREGR
jgi:LysR family glycine cleavage system transcriptional activator